MYSIYHFFKSLVNKKTTFTNVEKLDKFPFDQKLLSCKNEGIFPDLAIRLNKDRSIFTGGELIELKDSHSYTVSSFNSTIPTKQKEIDKIISGEKSIIKQQMEEAGNDIYSLSIRDVFYLVRGRKQGNTKVCLANGAFFETIRIEDLISQSFSQVLEERLKESGEKISDNFKEMLLSIFSQQENFSRVRTVDKASVKLRFRIMTEIKAEGNLLNSRKYPEIKDNTLNFLLPYYSEKEKQIILEKAKIGFGKRLLKSLNIFNIKHHFNGYFIVFQTRL